MDMVRVEELNRREMDYLLSIFINSKSKGYARNSEIVKELGVSKATASLMVKKLAEKNLVTASRRGVYLTERGRRIVREILWRHGTIEAALSKLGVPIREACRITWEIQLILPEEAVRVIWQALGAPRVCPLGVRFPRKGEESPVEEYDVCGFNLVCSSRNPKR